MSATISSGKSIRLMDAFFRSHTISFYKALVCNVSSKAGRIIKNFNLPIIDFCRLDTEPVLKQVYKLNLATRLTDCQTPSSLTRKSKWQGGELFPSCFCKRCALCSQLLTRWRNRKTGTLFE